MCRALLVSVALVLCPTARADWSITGVRVEANDITAKADEDKSIAAAGVSVKVKGQSGKMTLTVPTPDNSTMDVECEMDALRQLDADGIVRGRGEKYSINSFATQQFTFSEPTESTYGGLDVTKVIFDSTLGPRNGAVAKIKIEIMIFKEAGVFNVGNDTVNVTSGAVKFNVEMSEWVWCGGGNSCTGQGGDGASVELDIGIQSVGKGSPNPMGASGFFDLGGGRELLMLSTYSTDEGNSWKAMPDDYPKVNGSTFTLKFPRWGENEKVVYDPVVTSGLSTVTEAPPQPVETTVPDDGAFALGLHAALLVTMIALAAI